MDCHNTQRHSTMSGETGPIAVSLPISLVIVGFFAGAIFNTIEIIIWGPEPLQRVEEPMLLEYPRALHHRLPALLRPRTGPTDVCLHRPWLVGHGDGPVRHALLPSRPRLGRDEDALGTDHDHRQLLHPPCSRLILFIASSSGNPRPYINAFNVYEKVQLAGFSVQESIVSGLYLWDASTAINPIMAVKGVEGRKIQVSINL